MTFELLILTYATIVMNVHKCFNNIYEKFKLGGVDCEWL